MKVKAYLLRYKYRAHLCKTCNPERMRNAYKGRQKNEQKNLVSANYRSLCPVAVALYSRVGGVIDFITKHSGHFEQDCFNHPDPVGGQGYYSLPICLESL